LSIEEANVPSMARSGSSKEVRAAVVLLAGIPSAADVTIEERMLVERQLKSSGWIWIRSIISISKRRPIQR
jgi:hypothetical protein